MIKAIVTDIEGTTSSLSFVKDTLFPYARTRLPTFVREQAKNTKLREALQEARLAAGNPQMDDEDLIRRLLEWIEQDKKVTALKSIQGMIWEAGYRNGDFRGHIYPDAVEALKKWQLAGQHLYVYSSGSVQAQKLLFAHTDSGDLTGLFSGYFDTHIGPKNSVESYRRIADHIDVDPAELLFLSDAVAELDAAHQAGWYVVQLTRSGEAQPPAAYPTAVDFTSIDISRFQ